MSRIAIHITHMSAYEYDTKKNEINCELLQISVHISYKFEYLYDFEPIFLSSSFLSLQRTINAFVQQNLNINWRE